MIEGTVPGTEIEMAMAHWLGLLMEIWKKTMVVKASKKKLRFQYAGFSSINIIHVNIGRVKTSIQTGTNIDKQL